MNVRQRLTVAQMLDRQRDGHIALLAHALGRGQLHRSHADRDHLNADAILLQRRPAGIGPSVRFQRFALRAQSQRHRHHRFRRIIRTLPAGVIHRPQPLRRQPREEQEQRRRDRSRDRQHTAHGLGMGDLIDRDRPNQHAERGQRQGDNGQPRQRRRHQPAAAEQTRRQSARMNPRLDAAPWRGGPPRRRRQSHRRRRRGFCRGSRRRGGRRERRRRRRRQ